MLTHMHKGDTHCVYHLGARVRNFTDEQSDGATGALYRKDRVSQSGPDAGLNWTGASVQ